jgi:uncharacterized protein (TIGR02246 family)
MLAAVVLLSLPTVATAQRDDTAIVRAIATEWNRAYNARNADAVAALFDDRPIGLFVFGGAAVPKDSLKAFHERSWASRRDEAWTVDRADVVMLGDESALLTMTWSGRYTTAAGVTWEYKSSAIATVVAQRRGSTWKIVAMQNSGSGVRVQR